MLILRWLIMTLAVVISTYFIPGVKVTGLWPAMLVVLVLGFANVTIKPLLIVFTLPINILTLGLFTLVINGLIVWLISSIVKGFTVEGFFSAVLFSVVLSVVSYLLNILLGIKK